MDHVANPCGMRTYLVPRNLVTLADSEKKNIEIETENFLDSSRFKTPPDTSQVWMDVQNGKNKHIK